MNAVFFGRGAIERVYTKETRNKIASLCHAEPVCADFGNTEALREAEAVFTTWGMPHYTKEQIKTLFPRLRYVFYGAGSVRGFAAEFIDSGIHVYSAWAANAVPVAEYVCAQILLCGKRYFDIFTCAKGTPVGNYGLKVGLIGLGMIGSLLARMLSRYKLDVYAYDAFAADGYFDELGVKRASLTDIFKDCHVISNHLANNEATRGMINAELLSSMRKDAYFINTGRGAQVDHTALYEVMRECPLRTALLDVTEPEPLSPDSPLRTLKNVIISPHIAGSLGDEVGRMGEYMCSELEAILRGDKPLYEVSAEMLRTMA